MRSGALAQNTAAIGKSSNDRGPHWWSRNDGVEIMAMPQRDDTIEAIKRLEPPSRVRYGAPSALLEYAVMHGDEEEAERIREELRKLTDEV